MLTAWSVRRCTDIQGEGGRGAGEDGGRGGDCTGQGVRREGKDGTRQGTGQATDMHSIKVVIDTDIANSFRYQRVGAHVHVCMRWTNECDCIYVCMFVCMMCTAGMDVRYVCTCMCE